MNNKHGLHCLHVLKLESAMIHWIRTPWNRKTWEKARVSATNKLGEAPHGFIIMLIMPIILPFLGRAPGWTKNSLWKQPPLWTLRNKRQFTVHSQHFNAHRWLTSPRRACDNWAKGLLPANFWWTTLAIPVGIGTWMDSQVAGFSILSDCAVAKLAIYGLQRKYCRFLIDSWVDHIQLDSLGPKWDEHQVS